MVRAAQGEEDNSQAPLMPLIGSRLFDFLSHCMAVWPCMVADRVYAVFAWLQDAEIDADPESPHFSGSALFREITGAIF